MKNYYAVKIKWNEKNGHHVTTSIRFFFRIFIFICSLIYFSLLYYTLLARFLFDAYEEKIYIYMEAMVIITKSVGSLPSLIS